MSISLGCTWIWLTENAQALTFLATLAGVSVAVVYAILRYRLAVSAGDQAKAARQQADTMRSMFEAGNRPYLIMECAYGKHGGVVQNEAVLITLKNVGSVIAKVEDIAVDPQTGYRYPTKCPFYVLPKQEALAAYFLFSAGPSQLLNVEAKVTAGYQGLSEGKLVTVATVSAVETQSYLGRGEVTATCKIEHAT